MLDAIQATPKKPPKGFSKTPRALMRDPNLHPHAKLVALDLLTYLRTGETTCYPTQVSIARDTGLSRTTVNKRIQELQRLGGIGVNLDAMGRAKSYDCAELLGLLETDRFLSEGCTPSEHPLVCGDVRPVNMDVRPVNMDVRPVNTTRTDTEPNLLEDAPAPPSLGLSGVHPVPEGSVDELAPDSVAIHRSRLAPDGRTYRDAISQGSADYDLWETLTLVDGEPLNSGAVAEFDPELVWYHCAWLPRRIAAEFERTGRTVKKPTAFLMAAIRGDLPVRRNWPEYQSHRHGPDVLTYEDLDDLIPF